MTASTAVELVEVTLDQLERLVAHDIQPRPAATATGGIDHDHGPLGRHTHTVRVIGNVAHGPLGPARRGAEDGA